MDRQKELSNLMGQLNALKTNEVSFHISANVSVTPSMMDAIDNESIGHSSYDNGNMYVDTESIQNWLNDEIIDKDPEVEALMKHIVEAVPVFTDINFHI